MPASALPGAPELPMRGKEPVFSAPWEARAFAIVVLLHRQSRYSWEEWVSYLAGEIAQTSTGDGKPYYEQWLAACERLLRDKGMLESRALLARMADIEQRAGAKHDHDKHRAG